MYGNAKINLIERKETPKKIYIFLKRQLYERQFYKQA